MVRRLLTLLLALAAASAALAAVETTTVSGSIVTPNGNPVTSGSVTCTLSSPGRAPDGASTVGVSRVYTTTISSAGAVSFTLVPNDVITPVNTTYDCVFTIKTPVPERYTWTRCSVSSSPDPLQIGAMQCDVAVNPPPAVPGAANTMVKSSGAGSLSAMTGLCVSLIGARGATTDASGDGTPDQALYQAVDVECDGTHDYFFGPAGIGDVFNRRESFIATAVISGDNHGENWTLMSELCAEYGLACTMQIVYGPYSAVNLPSSAELQEYGAAGNEISGHSAAHHFGGVDTSDGNPNVGSSVIYGPETTGTVVCTNGSATVEGTGVTWAQTQGGRFSPTGAYFICDWNNDGAINATDRAHVFTIASVTDSNTLVLDRAFDGTTNNTAKPYEIRSNYANTLWEIEANEAALRAVLGTTWQQGYWVDPGNWTPADDLSVLVKAYAGVMLAGSYQSTVGSGTQELGHTFGSMADPLRMSWVQSTCNWTTAYVDALLAAAVKERLFLNFNVHDVTPDAFCSSTTDDIKESVFEYLLAKLREYQAKGQMQVLRGEDAIGYWRLRRAQPSWQLLRNAHFFDSTSGGYLSRHAIPGWEENDYDGSLAGVNGPVSLDCDGTGAGTTAYTFDGDGAGTLTWTYSDGANVCTATIDQAVVLAPGTYQFAADIDARDLAAGLVRINLYDAYTYPSDFTGILDPVWYESIDGYQYSATVYPPYTNFGERRTVMGTFRIPEGMNQAITVMFQVTGGRGTARIKSPVLIRRALPMDLDAEYSGGNGLSDLNVSRMDPTLTGKQLPNAFNYVWVPQEDRLTDTPANKLFSYSAVGAGGTLREDLVSATITGAGTAALSVAGYAYDATCADTAGAATITADNCGMVTLTGTAAATTTLNTCNAANRGRRLTAICGATATSVVGFTDGGNLKLAGNFVCTADDTITLVCDGTTACAGAGCWIEVGRSVN